MIAVGQQHRVAVADDVRDALTVRGIEQLLAEALCRIDPEVVHLLEHRLAILAVVFVRRIAAPVSGRVERLADHDPLGRCVGDEDVVHLARVVAATARVDADVGRRDKGRPPGTLCRRRHHNSLKLRCRPRS